MNKIIYNLSAYDFTNGYLDKLLAVADRAIKGSVAYNFSAADAAFCYEFGGKQPKYATLAVSMVTKRAADSKAAIAAGGQPTIANDSYLYAGGSIESLLLTLDWCAEYLSDGLKADILSLANQTAYNIANPTKAAWGGKLFPWSGWGINDPENNYYFSFAQAFAMIGLIEPNGPWLPYVTATIRPRLENFYRPRDGGGSGEGTGYGEVVAQLYRVTRLLKDSAVIEFPSVSEHASDTIHYLVHASKPGLKKLANIGDQPREHDNAIDDPDEVVVLEAMAISTDERAKALGRWWLDNNGEIFDRTDLYRFACLNRRGERSAPTELVYLAKSVGHLFARTSWSDPLASWMCLTCGPQNQSHDDRAQGGLSFHSGGVSLSETQNARSRTGINQVAEYQNVLLFRDAAGVKVEQNTTGIGALSCRLEDGYLIADADASPAYAKIKWRRQVSFQNGFLRVGDTYETPIGYSATCQINTPYLPTIDRNVIAAGNLRISIIGDYESLSVTVTDWKVVSPAENPYGGYKINIICKGGKLITEWRDTSVSQMPFPHEDAGMIKELQAQVVALNLAVAQSQEKISQLTENIDSLTRLTDEQAKKLADQAPQIALHTKLTGALKEAVTQAI